MCLYIYPVIFYFKDTDYSKLGSLPHAGSPGWPPASGVSVADIALPPLLTVQQRYCEQ